MVRVESKKQRTERSPFLTRRRAILGVVLVGLLLRIWAAWQLPQDFDEPVYLNAAYDYAELLRAGDLNGIIDYPGVTEHPPLMRLIYAGVLLALGNRAEWNTALLFCRLASAVFGTLGVWVMALIDPLAGFLWAVQTLAVKYSSQVYLEALPGFTMLLAVYTIRRSQGSRDGWFWLSALALGLTAAGKYSYFPILFVILYIAMGEKRYRDASLLIYLGVAAVTFLVFDPALWHAPLSRFLDSILFHAQYSQGAHVQEVGYPWYQPFIWVWRSNGFIWHPEVFFYLGIDGLIFLLALPGLWLEWKERRYYIPFWVVSGMLFLLLWPTKWPQYTLVVLPAFCLAAAVAMRWLYRYLKEQDTYWEWFGNMFPHPSRRFLIVAGIAMGVLLLAATVTVTTNAINRIGWSSILTENSSLPSDTVYALQALPDGRMAIGTDRGLALWTRAEKDDVKDKWEILNPENSPLPERHVLSLAIDQEGELWSGTAGGLARFDGATWQVYSAKDFGLESAQVNTMEVGSDGRVWIGTQAGAAVFDGATWTSYTPHDSGLWDETVFSLAVQPGEQGDVIWFGMTDAVSRLDTVSGEWHTTLAEEISIGEGGVADLLVDSRGRVWAATLGSGIGVWDGQSWSALRTSNSDLPYNTVQVVTEIDPGIFWIGSSNPADLGGLVSRLEGEEWKTFKPILSGYTGGETLAIAQDSEGRLWFGTRTKGINIYAPRK